MTSIQPTVRISGDHPVGTGPDRLGFSVGAIVVRLAARPAKPDCTCHLVPDPLRSTERASVAVLLLEVFGDGAEIKKKCSGTGIADYQRW